MATGAAYFCVNVARSCAETHLIRTDVSRTPRSAQKRVGDLIGRRVRRVFSSIVFAIYVSIVQTVVFNGRPIGHRENFGTPDFHNCSCRRRCFGNSSKWFAQPNPRHVVCTHTCIERPYAYSTRAYTFFFYRIHFTDVCCGHRKRRTVTDISERMGNDTERRA